MMSPANVATIRLDTCPGCNASDFTQLYEIQDVISIPVDLCNNCGLVFQRTPLSEDALQGYYESNTVFCAHGKGSRQEKLVAARHAFLEQSLDNVQAQRPCMVDVGCGYGDFLASFDGTVWDRVGLELNPVRALFARQRFGLTIIESPLETAGLEDESVHLLTGFGLIEHFHDIRSFLESVHRIIAPGGLGVFSVADLDNPDHGASDYFSLEHILYFNHKTLAALVSAAGFMPIRTGPLTPPAYKDIAVLFKKSCDRFDWNPMPPMRQEADAIRQRIGSYLSRHQTYLSRLRGLMLEAGLFSNLKRLGIYGAGGHTEQMIAAIPELNAVTVYFDSDESKHGNRFLHGKVYPPEAIERLDLDTILISSRAFEDEIYDRVKRLAPKQMRIVALYRQFGDGDV